MTNKVRVGIVSTSWWADEMYLPALKSHSQAVIAAICGRNRSRAEEMAAKYGIPSVFVDYHAMIEHGGLDAVVVAAPDDLHYEITMRALEAGLHVLCEKPFAMTAHEAREMYDKAEAARVRHMVLFTYRWMPFMQYTRDLIQQGYVGRLYHAEFRYLAGFGRRKEYIWRMDRNHSNGVLGDLGAHLIDMARWMVGDINRVSAHLRICVDRPDPDDGPIDPANDSALLLVEFANGAHGVIQASCVAYMAERRSEQQIRLCGEDGTLELTFHFGGADAGGIVRAARSHADQFQQLLVPDSYWTAADKSEPFSVFTTQPVGARLFIDSILDGRSITPNFYDGYKAQQVIEAALQSHTSGRVETIESAA